MNTMFQGMNKSRVLGCADGTYTQAQSTNMFQLMNFTTGEDPYGDTITIFRLPR